MFCRSLRSLGLLVALVVAGCGAAAKVADLTVTGPSRELRPRPKGTPPRSEKGGKELLLVLFDGVDRTTLYELLRSGRMPALAGLLGGSGGELAHAHLDDRLLATLPSSTMAAWTTALTGRAPADHGVTGNEFFIREALRLGAPAPVTFDDAAPTLAIYTDAYLDGLKVGPSVYDRMRERDPNVLVWVAMHGITSGADRLLVTKRSIFADAFEHLVERMASDPDSREKLRKPYATLDRQAVDVVVDELEKGPVPDVLTLYLSGTDLYAHVAPEGPDEARRTYLTEIVDPALAKLGARLRARGALDDRYVVVTSDHGHTQVIKDEAHALSADRKDGPTKVLERASYRLRPFKLDVDPDAIFDAVWVAGGATAFVYAADRATCPGDKTRCDWSRPPRYAEDVLPIAEAFFRADESGALVPQMKGTLDLVLTRRPRPYAEIDLPFEVYVGGGRTMPVDAWLKSHAHESYVELSARLHDLGVGPRGERAGDVVLFAHNGDRDRPEERYYFAAPYRSWHGSPSRRDSELPFIVAHPKAAPRELAGRVDRHLSDRPLQQKVTDVVLDLRYGNGAPR